MGQAAAASVVRQFDQTAQTQRLEEIYLARDRLIEHPSNKSFCVIVSPLWVGRIWKIVRRFSIFPASGLIMGVLNVTPDSFSDGGDFSRPEKAVATV